MINKTISLISSIFLLTACLVSVSFSKVDTNTFFENKSSQSSVEPSISNDFNFLDNSSSFLPISTCIENTIETVNTEAIFSFDNTTDDEDGTNNPDITSSITFDTDNIAGGNSLIFDGITEMGFQPSSTADTFGRAFRNVSVGFWIKPDAVVPTTNEILYEEGGTSVGFVIYREVTTGNIVTRIRNGARSVLIADFPYPTDNDWHHIAFTFNNGRGVTYLDGEIGGDVTVSTTLMPAHTNASGFGGIYGGLHAAMDVATAFSGYEGKMDEAFYSYNTIRGGQILQYIQCLKGSAIGDSNPILCPDVSFQTNNGEYYSIDLASGETIQQTVTNTVFTNTLAAGFNENDGLIYSLTADQVTITEIEETAPKTYEFTNHKAGPVVGLPPRVNYVAGDVYNNKLYVKTTSLLVIYEIDIDNTSPTYLTVTNTILLSNNIAIGDFVISNGILYAVAEDGNAYTIDLTTGNVTSLRRVAGVAPPLAGMFMDGEGFVYAVNNTTGIIYRLDVSGAFPKVVEFSNTISMGPNDGIFCKNNTFNFDFGDAPDSYGTTLVNSGNGGPRHLITNYDAINYTSNLSLGATIDRETDGFVSLANGDNNDEVVDEDALTTIQDIDINGTTHSITIPYVNNTGSDATIYAWIDFDRNGTFDDNEEFTSVTASSGATSAILNWTFPGDITLGNTYMRFRITSDVLTDITSGNIDDRALGFASNGEVEDYAVRIDGGGNISACLIDYIRVDNTEAVFSFDNTTNDEDGTNNPDVTSSITFDTDNIAGGNSLVFDGTTEMGFQHSTTTETFGRAFRNMSVGFWIKPDSNTPTTNQMLYEEGGNGAGLAIFRAITTGNITVRIRNGATSALVANFEYPTDNEWHHITFTFNNGRCLSYLDGELEGDVTVSSTQIPAHLNESGFGGIYGGLHAAMDVTTAFGGYEGKMDEAFYSYNTFSGGQLLQYTQCTKGTVIGSSNPILCPTALFQVATGEFYEINLFTGNSVQQTVTNEVYSLSNAYGYNENDGLSYSIVDNEKVIITEMIETASGFEFTNHLVGPVIGIPTAGKLYVAGDVSDNKLYVKSVVDSEIHEIDIDPTSPTYLTVTNTITISPTLSVQTADIVVNDGTGFLVGLDQVAYSVDLTTGALTTLGAVPYPVGNTSSVPHIFGAMFMDADDFIYGIQNNTGTVYRMDLNVSPPTIVEFSTSVPTATNDGFNCKNVRVNLDYGDAPDSYGTVLVASGVGGPRHLINNYDEVNNTSSLSLGSTVDSETDGFDSLAIGDDNDGINDEDALASSVPNVDINGTNHTITIPYVNTTGVDATIYAWIDFDRNGTFDDNEEFISAIASSGGTSVSLTWSFPIDVTSGTTYMRFRITSDTLTDTTSGGTDDRAIGAAIDGEVEDYEVEIIDCSSLVEAGISGGVISICSTGIVSELDLLNNLTGEDAGGSWTTSLGIPVVFPITVAGDYTYTVTGSGACISETDTATVTITVTDAPEAGISGGVISICSTESVSELDLLNNLTGEDAGGSWTTSLGIPVVFPITVAGDYTYTVTGSGACISETDTATVTITVTDAPEAGISGGVISICSTESVSELDLLNNLTGEDAGGSWTTSLGAPVVFPITAAGDYTYTVTGSGACISETDTAIVTISVTDAPEAGISGGVISICSTESVSELDVLNNLRGEDAGGSWTTNLGASVVFPITVAGDYTYTVTGSGACISETDTATVTISVTDAPEAGISGGVISICSTGIVSELDLLNNLTGEDAGGSWTTSLGIPVVFPITAAGDYTYTVTGSGACISETDTAIVTISVTDAPEAGVSSGIISICSTESVSELDLLNNLTGEDAGGSWTTSLGAPVVFPITAAGDYTYTVTGSGACISETDTAIVTISVTDAPEAGISGGVISICSTESVSELDVLNNLRGEDAGGSWTTNLGASVVFPITVAGDYTYTVTGSGACISETDTAIVTISVTDAPEAGVSSGIISICSTESVSELDLLNNLTGEDSGGNWTTSLGVPVVFPISVAGDYTYTVTGSGACISETDTATVTISVTDAPEAGISGGVISICSTGIVSELDLLNNLTGEDAGGSWTTSLGIPVVFPITAAGDYTYTVTGSGACISETDTAIVTISVTDAPEAGVSSGIISICSTESVSELDLLNNLTGEDAGGSWTTSLGAPVVFPITAAGDYTYTVTGSGACISETDTAIVTISVTDAPEAGISGGVISICSTESVSELDVLNNLRGEDAGGSWTTNLGASVVFPITVAGDYTYTVTGSGACISETDTAIVTISVTDAPEAGVSSGIISICSTESVSELDLLNNLTGEDSGGNWTTSLGVPVVFPISVAGDYTYTVTGSGACISETDTATVTISVTDAPEAGISGGVISICSTGIVSELDLLNNLTGEDAGGSWTTSLGIPVVFPITVAGDYTYTVTGSGACISETDTAIVTISVTDAPEAGVSSGIISICSTESVSELDLLNNLTGEDSGGNWTTSLGVPVVFPISVAGDYTYTVTGSGACISETDTATVTISVTDAPEAGISGGVISICSTGIVSELDLLNNLTGEDAGGSWTTSLGIPVVFPITAAGDYTYTVTGSGACISESDTATVTISVTDAPEAGISGGVISICSTESVSELDLLNNLTGEDAGGSWTNSLGIPVVFPITAAGNYTYTVTGSGACSSETDTATVTISITDAPEAGISGGVISICSTESVSELDLLNNLTGEDAGGSWTTSLGAPVVFPISVAGYYTYTVTGSGACISETDTATVTISVTDAPEAGISSGAISICSTESVSELDVLNNLTGEDAGGSWTNSLGVPVLFPITTAGDYTYTVTGSGACSSETDTATVTISITDAPEAGVSGGAISICSTESVSELDLLNNLTGEDAGGSWTTSLGAPVVFPITVAGDYTYTVTGSGACISESDTATVTISITDAPEAGVSGGVISICSTESVSELDLLNNLTGEDAGGSWTNSLGIPVVFPITAAGNYTYTVTGSGACISETDTATVTISITDAPEAGISGGVISICSTESVSELDLLNNLTGEDAGGSWTNSLGIPVVFPITAAGNYTYTVTGSGACISETDTAIVTISVTDAPEAGISGGVISICSTESVSELDLLNNLTGEDAGGSWTTSLGAPVVFPITAAGDYTYTVTGSGACSSGSDTATVTISITGAPEAGISGGVISICSTESVSELDLLNNLTGEDAGGSWTTSLGVPVVFPITAAGDYTYTVTGSGACISETDTATVTISITDAPEAGISGGVISICSTESVSELDLLNNLTDEDAGGSWTTSLGVPVIFPITAAGDYTYTVTGSGTCSSETDTAIVRINESSAPITPSAVVTQPTCLVPSGTITFVVQPNVEYSIDGINFQTSEVFMSLSPNTYTLTVRRTTGLRCTTVSPFPVTINSVPSSPSIPVLASVLQPTCSISTGTITFVSQPNVEYSIDGITFRTSEIFSNVPPNTYNLTVRSSIERNCITTNPIPVTINAVPASPTVPVLASVLQPTCSIPTGTITFVSQLNVEYSIDGITFQSSEIFTNLLPNTYDLTVRSTVDATCSATSSVPVVINSVPIPPAVPVLASVLQPTCSVPTGTITFVSQPNVEYSFDGITFQSSEVFSNLSPDTYDLTVRSTVDTTCSATSSVPVVINSVPIPPVVPVLASVLQPTCSIPTGTITFVSQPNVEYSIDGITFQLSEIFSNLSPNTYDLTVRSTVDITCSATSSVPVVINSVPSPPAVPVLASVLQPTCSIPTGTITFVSQPNIEYSIDGITFQSSEIFSNLPPNTYDLTVRSTVDATCSATSSVPVVINSVPSSPTVPVLASVLQPTCSIPTGTITFVNQPNVEYSIDGITFQSSEVFSNLPPNTYDLTVRSTVDATCSATSSVPVVINSVPTPPAVPVLASVLQPTCSTPIGTITFVSQPNVEYSIDGVTFQSSEVFSNLSPNTYDLTVRSTVDATCSATSSVPVVINSVPSPPTVPVLASVLQPTCSIPTGTITFVNQPNVEYSIDGITFQSSEVFVNLSPNTYDLTVRSTVDITCLATSSVPVVINSVPIPPAVPVLASVLQPTCSIPTGTITIVSQPNVEYSIDGITFQTSEVFSNLSPDTYDLTVRSTVDATCSATSSVPVVINSVPIPPAVPVLASVLQPTCSIPTGTITFVNQPNVEYSIDGITFQSSEIFTNLSPNTYDLTVRSTVDTTCSATSSVSVMINSVPNPPVINATVTIEPSCTINTGEITISNPVGNNFEYSINGTTFQSSPIFSNLLPDTYQVTVRDITDITCISNTSLNIVAAPVVNLAITCPPSITLECGASLETTNTGMPTVIESCGEVTFTFTDSNLINGCNGNTGTFIRTFTATDERGDTVMCTQEIIIEDNTPPVFNTTIPPNLLVSCDSIPEIVTVQATDTCDDTVNITFSENRIDGTCSNRYLIERIWTATDVCGNASTFTQELNVFCPIKVYNGVSFNNDGSNDIFLLEGIECYANNTVKIFNRWGVLVFETENYDNVNNVFRGVSDGRLTIARNEKLPTGTYFYIIKYDFPNNGNLESLTKSGYLYIND
ncbi:GEVED domain-containing protein [Tenacibaculum jejuense]|nr:GEVED domain-containing protein [Tenacibaculum jejuense]